MAGTGNGDAEDDDAGDEAGDARERASREAGMAETVERKASRKERARSERRHGVWFGLGMFGLIGWAVAVPTLVGTAIGLWLDGLYPGEVSWTLAGIGAGIAVGCLNAWWWVRRHMPDGEDRR